MNLCVNENNNKTNVYNGTNTNTPLGMQVLHTRCICGLTRVKVKIPKSSHLLLVYE